MCLSRCGADSEDGSVPARLPPRLRSDEYERSWRRVDRLAVDLEGRVPVEDEVEILRVYVDSERVDPEMLAHRNIAAESLDLVEVGVDVALTE
jgi:hypothetical protein